MTSPDGPMEIRHPAPGATPAEHLRAIALILIVVLPTGFFDLGRGDLVNSLEVGYALTVQEMARDGNWLVPTLNDRPRVLKPPLPFWIGAAAAWTFEDGQASVELLRLVATCFGALTAILVYLIGTRLFDRRAGLWAGLAWATMYLPVYEYTFARHDVFLAAFCALAMLGLCKAWQRERWGWAIGAVGLALAFQAKGPVSWVLVSLPTAAFVLINRPIRWRYLLALTGCSLGAGLTLVPWLMYVEATVSQGRWGNWYLSEGFARAVQDYRPSNPVFFYLLIFAYVLPWASYFVTGLVVPWEKRFANRAVALRLPWMWLVAGLVLMTLPRERETRYIVPLAAPAALLIGAMVGFHLDIWKRKAFDPKAGAVWVGHTIALLGVSIGLPIAVVVGGLVELPIAIAGGGVLLALTVIVGWSFVSKHMLRAAVVTVMFGMLMHIGWQAAYAVDPLGREPLRDKAAEMRQLVDDAAIISWPRRPPHVLIYYLGRSAPNLVEYHAPPSDDATPGDVLADYLGTTAPRSLYVIVTGAGRQELTDIATANGYTAAQHMDLTTRKPRKEVDLIDPVFLYRLNRTSPDQNIGP